MKNLILVVLIAASAFSISACGSKLKQGDAAEQNQYAVYTAEGQEAAVQTDAPAPVTLTDAVKPENLNKKLRVEAKVEEVCQVKGCWMIVTDGTNHIRVTFRDYGFFVPKDIAGKTIMADGIVSETVTTEADARHYAEDAGKSAEEISAIVGDQKELAMEADVVLIAQQQ